MGANISIHGSHNSTVVVENNGEILTVLEVERFIGYKNTGIAQYKVAKDGNLTLELILEWIRTEFGIERFDTCYWAHTQVVHDGVCVPMHKYIPADLYKEVGHHYSHASGTFYQSPYQDALIFSFDGGGNDGTFHVYLANRTQGVNFLTKISCPTGAHPSREWDLGFPYMLFGHYLSDIKQEVLGDGVLVYPGKLMGLASYGNVREDWLPHFMEFYRTDVPVDPDLYLNILGQNIGVTFDAENRLDGQLAYDIAATSQRAFEDSFIQIARPFFEQYPTLPVCLTGGCALNIILNTRLVNELGKTVFIGPVPNDTGLALGMMLSILKPKEPYVPTYAGIPILDKNLLPTYIQDRSNVRKLTRQLPKYKGNPPSEANFQQLIRDIIEGHIVGVIRGNSEYGPRALGNRSILCNPNIPNMKDILNNKVKHREWYRPFAPVVRLEDVSKYFEWDGESTWMSFCPTVRPEWRNILTAITHVDNTARVQTVTREQNKWLYDLLTEVNSFSGIGVLLNTSFNVAGKPIVNSLKEAFQVFDTTQMDGLLIEDFYFRKTDFHSISYEY